MCEALWLGVDRREAWRRCGPALEILGGGVSLGVEIQVVKEADGFRQIITQVLGRHIVKLAMDYVDTDASGYHINLFSHWSLAVVFFHREMLNLLTAPLDTMLST